MEAFAARITHPGWSNALGAKLLQLTAPGVPDVYQGTELWDFSLVDPDNRRPVDYDLRRRMLADLDRGCRRSTPPARPSCSSHPERCAHVVTGPSSSPATRR